MDLYGTSVLSRVVATIPTPAAFLLNMFFPVIETSQTETIMFDVDEGKRRISPFVAPHMPGKVVANRGFRTDSFKPAYVKDKRRFDPSRGFKRMVGEQIGGNMTPEQRIKAHLGNELRDQVDMLTRRLEVMAAEVMRTGKIVVKGDDYPATTVDFGRNPDLTITLAGAARWGEGGVDPINDIEEWCGLTFIASGVAPTDVVVDGKAWNLIKASPRFDKMIDKNKNNSAKVSADLGITIPNGARLVGQLGDVRVWLYAERYIDPEDNVEKSVLPDYSVMISSSGLEGVRHFGAIHDEEAGLQAMPYFAKSWVVPDPSVRWLLMQSAPLVVPYRVNASFFAKVR